jgi:2-polyprenyl-3-methyl-5-hydroxy-6-metoxy-1,4-benzoquinol methylase
MAPIRQRFIAQLPPGAHILDAGCGSGREARAFADAGFQVTAFDASAELARLASAHCGFDVAARRFEEVDEVAQFDGIWSCASLLHVPLAAMPDTLARLWTALRPGGTQYVSVKHGTGERTHGGRRFTDADEATLRAWFASLPEAHRLEVWLTDDQRPERTERWTHALARRQPAPNQQRLVTGGTDDHFLPHLSQAFTWATQTDLAVAFVKTTGLRLLMPDLASMVDAGARRRGARVHHRAGGRQLPSQGLPLRPAGPAGAGGRHRVHRLQQHQPAGAAGRAGVELPGRLPAPGVLREMPVGKERLFIHPKLMQLLGRDDNGFQLYA